MRYRALAKHAFASGTQIGGGDVERDARRCEVVDGRVLSDQSPEETAIEKERTSGREAVSDADGVELKVAIILKAAPDSS